MHKHNSYLMSFELINFYLIFYNTQTASPSFGFVSLAFPLFLPSIYPLSKTFIFRIFHSFCPFPFSIIHFLYNATSKAFRMGGSPSSN